MTNTQITALITAIEDGGLNTALEVRTVLTAIKNACVIPNEVKWIKLQNLDLPTYFVATGATAGLGIAGELYEGWAICNGNNTTTNDNGKVSIAYGTNYTTLGATGGSKDAVIVNHTHGQVAGDYIFDVGAGSGGRFATANGVTGAAIGGVSGTDKNMQPYVVEVKIQRIA